MPLVLLHRRSLAQSVGTADDWNSLEVAGRPRYATQVSLIPGEPPSSSPSVGAALLAWSAISRSALHTHFPLSNPPCVSRFLIVGRWSEMTRPPPTVHIVL